MFPALRVSTKKGGEQKDFFSAVFVILWRAFFLSAAVHLVYHTVMRYYVLNGGSVDRHQQLFLPEYPQKTQVLPDLADDGWGVTGQSDTRTHGESPLVSVSNCLLSITLTVFAPPAYRQTCSTRNKSHNNGVNKFNDADSGEFLWTVIGVQGGEERAEKSPVVSWWEPVRMVWIVCHKVNMSNRRAGNKNVSSLHFNQKLYYPGNERTLIL